MLGGAVLGGLVGLLRRKGQAKDGAPALVQSGHPPALPLTHTPRPQPAPSRPQQAAGPALWLLSRPLTNAQCSPSGWT